ncbi:hypothetical protein EON64_09360 [archaeon]|nr:MAG: hypothetical protein EON64_09360 [archaeon]
MDGTNEERVDSEDEDDNMPDPLYSQPAVVPEQPIAKAGAATGTGAARPVKAKSLQGLRKGKWTVSGFCYLLTLSSYLVIWLHGHTMLCSIGLTILLFVSSYRRRRSGTR